jgi:hypothetical protein
MIDVFLHIPKTGGTSLHRALRLVYIGEKIYTSPPEIRNPEVIAEKVRMKSKVRLIRGHVDYGIHHYVSEPCRYFTVLRNPIKRIVSLFYDVKHWRNDTEVASMQLGEYIESNHPSYVQNDQVKRLAGAGGQDCQADDELLELAKNNLSQYITAFGLTERYDESVIVLRRLLGWSRYPLYIRGKTNNHRPPLSAIDSGILKAIHHQNQMDMSLYQFARDRFEEQLKAIGSIESELHRFQKLNSIYGTAGRPLLKAYSKAKRIWL